MKADREATEACLETMEACLESMEQTSFEIQSKSEHQEVPKEDATVNFCESTEEAVQGLPSSCRALPMAEKKDPGQ